MISDWLCWISIVLGIAVGGGLLGITIFEAKFERAAVERGYALYCPTNGHFAWKGECND